jgi:RNA polymerase sigma-B factor
LIDLGSEIFGEVPLDVERAPTDALWRIRNQHPAARGELVRRYLPLARKLAVRYQSSYEQLEDLVQVANVGLLGAVDRFDPSRGAPFTAFATPTILGELKRHFRNTGWSLHVPRGMQELVLRVQKAVAELTERNGRSPEIQELAEYLELSVEETLGGLEAAQAHHAASLDAPTGEDESDNATLADLLGDIDQRYALIDTTSVLRNAIAQLPNLERTALTLRMCEDLKQTEIARAMGCSQMQVSRLLRRATDRLQWELRASEEPGRER